MQNILIFNVIYNVKMQNPDVAPSGRETHCEKEMDYFIDYLGLSK